MTDKERYQRTFSLLQASEHCFTEVKRMNTKKSIPVRRLMSACAAAVMVLALAGAAYAADLGGIQRTVQVWVHGDQTSAILNVRDTWDSEYTLTYDEAGETKEVHGGGVAIEDDGTERPLTLEEIEDLLDSPEVEYKEDGTVWVYYRGQTLDVTDCFTDGVCYVQLKDGKDVLYLTVKYQNGFATSPHSFLCPEEFNCGDD